ELSNAVILSRSKAAKLRICEEQEKIVIKKTKEDVWQIAKFVTCTKDLEHATEKALDYCNFPEKTPQERDSWIVTYKMLSKLPLTPNATT
ncbi:MAG: hypothetical protein LC650_05950, partial [Actinobacteria bacterium]|nr:hypothetical protein [Actinomycetota bacterium]